jgi:hypothetical protein
LPNHMLMWIRIYAGFGRELVSPQKARHAYLLPSPWSMPRPAGLRNARGRLTPCIAPIVAEHINRSNETELYKRSSHCAVMARSAAYLGRTFGFQIERCCFLRQIWAG